MRAIRAAFTVISRSSLLSMSLSMSTLDVEGSGKPYSDSPKVDIVAAESGKVECEGHGL